ncbi:alpha/beta fold hydrolase [Nonomuraea aurantiaca]|uniref:alpha/beta fold hydrolase n=1 Tax=Nonomuraea aurantiaca TaxID=2878562 RepID=UPI001CD994F1|nr:hypothetical protein [Nonomuraea aurantiaca]MCA2229495.1 hypothetical protein [Nonomuraea aurantiaca]
MNAHQSQGEQLQPINDVELCVETFGDIAAPTLVAHGDHDPLLPLPHGKALRDAIPGVELMVLEGAGHDLPGRVWDDLVTALVQHTEALVEHAEEGRS